MLSDHTLTLAIETPTDAYGLKRAVYTVLSRQGIPVEPRTFLYGRCPIDGSVMVRSSDERLAAISADTRRVPKPKMGKQYDFCLRATPMHQTPFGKQSTDPQNWLISQTEQIGVELVTSQHRTSWTWCGKRTKAGMSGFYVPDVTFLGCLRVKDTTKLADALVNGIGRHRAFGFGLLQLY